MQTDREVTRIVRSWLEEGATALPDRVLDAVLDQVPATSQRRSWWPSWRFTDMNNVLKLAMGAAAVLVVALVGYSFLPRSGGVGAPDQTPSPSPSPSFEAALGPLAPGTYIVDDPTLTTVPFTLTVPSGWTARDDGVIVKAEDQPGWLEIQPWNVTHVYADACGSEPGLTEIGPTVDDLVRALEDQEGSDASTPVEVTLGGFPAKRIEMSVPVGQDPSTCRFAPNELIQIWADAEETRWFAIPVDHASLPGLVVYIVDVDGERAVILAGHKDSASTSAVAELQTVVDSIAFQP